MMFLAFVFINLIFSQTINVYLVNDHGGYGDIASGIRTARLLKDQRPELIINIIVKDDIYFVRKVCKLVPEFDSSHVKRQARNKQGVMLSGFRYFLLKEHILDGFVDRNLDKYTFSGADFSFSFSTDTYIPTALVGHSAYSFIFREFNSRNAENYIPSSNSYRLNTGFGATNYGFYVSDKEKKFSFDEMLDRLKRETGLSPKINSNSLIGFAYAQDDKVKQRYFNVMSKLADKKYPNKDLYIFYTGTPIESTKLNERVKPILLASSSLELTKMLMQHVNIPVLVTGDVSLSLAIQNELPFMYDMMPWKESLASRLLMYLSLTINPEESNVLSELFSSVLGRDYTDGNINKNKIEDNVFKLFSNDSYIRLFKSKLKWLKNTYSFPKNLLILMDHMKKVEGIKPINKENPENIAKYLDFFKLIPQGKGEDLDKLLQDIDTATTTDFLVNPCEVAINRLRYITAGLK